MATCGSLRSLFEKPLPENPTLMESLSSWNQIKPKKPAAVDPASFTELFGELHFQENPPPPPLPSSPAFSDRIPPPPTTHNANANANANANGFAKSPCGWQLCTEGLGSESSDDVDDLMMGGGDDEGTGEKAESERKAAISNGDGDGDGGGHPCCYSDVRARNGGGFPPPISSIGRSGKPWVCFRPYREEGRFVLREIRIPSQEFLHASREDGRLKLQFVHPDEDIEEGDEEEGEEEEQHEEEGDAAVNWIGYSDG